MILIHLKHKHIDALQPSSYSSCFKIEKYLALLILHSILLQYAWMYTLLRRFADLSHLLSVSPKHQKQSLSTACGAFHMTSACAQYSVYSILCVKVLSLMETYVWYFVYLIIITPFSGFLNTWCIIQKAHVLCTVSVAMSINKICLLKCSRWDRLIFTYYISSTITNLTDFSESKKKEKSSVQVEFGGKLYGNKNQN